MKGYYNAVEAKDKTKYSLREQIEHLRNRGILFNIIPGDEAVDYLYRKNYFFRVKSYLNNYKAWYNPVEKVYMCNIEFAHLCKLASLDVMFRKIILSTALDVEHFLKVGLMQDVLREQEEDGFKIVKHAFYYNAIDFLPSNYEKSFCNDLIQSCNGKFAVWELIEVLSLGNFNKLYTYYYREREREGISLRNYSSYLESIRFIRNGAAHNNCLLSRISKKQEISPTKGLVNNILKADNISREEANEMLSNKVTHDFLSLVWVLGRAVPKCGLKKERFAEIDGFLEKCIESEPLFEENVKIVNFFGFLRKSVDLIAKRSL